jgi:calcineurin-like phosphoesterase family protein
MIAAAGTPAEGASDPVIAAAGDIACDPVSGAFNAGLGTTTQCRQLYTSDLLTGGSYTAVLPLGDLQYENGVLADFLLSYDLSWGRVKQITRPVPGNHEYHTPGAAGYFNYFNGIGSATGPAGDSGRGYYSYNIRSWHLVALNSNCGAVRGCGPNSPQGRWLAQDLAASNASCTLAYWHHPLFSSGEYSPGINSVRPLFQQLYDQKVDVVLNGHDHNYERFAPQNASGALESDRGIRQFIVGTGGKNNYPQGTPLAGSEARSATSHGILELTLRPTGYDWRFVPAAGDTFTDSGSEGCRNASRAAEHSTPQSAERLEVRLVPSFDSCTVPNAIHSEPLATLSCQPPVPGSAHLTVGTPDGNGAPVNFTGFVGLRVLGEVPIDSQNGDQADVEVTAQLTDVRTGTDLGDYAGELEGRLQLRVTDRGSGITGSTPATAVDLPLSFAIPCQPTADPDLGSDCAVTTSIDTLMAGAVTESQRSVWELSEARVLDGGPDGLASTADNTPFAEQGIFAP